MKALRRLFQVLEDEEVRGGRVRITSRQTLFEERRRRANGGEEVRPKSHFRLTRAVGDRLEGGEEEEMRKREERGEERGGERRRREEKKRGEEER